MNHPVTASELLSNPTVVDGLRLALGESGMGTNHPVEQGGFILYDPDGAVFELDRLPGTQRDSLVYPFRPDGTFKNKQIVGSFHTHPNTGPEWRQEPSPQDIRLSVDYPETMGQHQFVVSSDAVYHIDNSGTVTDMGSTSRLLTLE